MRCSGSGTTNSYHKTTPTGRVLYCGECSFSAPKVGESMRLPLHEVPTIDDDDDDDRHFSMDDVADIQCGHGMADRIRDGYRCQDCGAEFLYTTEWEKAAHNED